MEISALLRHAQTLTLAAPAVAFNTAASRTSDHPETTRRERGAERAGYEGLRARAAPGGVPGFRARQGVSGGIGDRRASAKSHENRDSNMARNVLQYQVKFTWCPGEDQNYPAKPLTGNRTANRLARGTRIVTLRCQRSEVGPDAYATRNYTQYT